MAVQKSKSGANTSSRQSGSSDWALTAYFLNSGQSPTKGATGIKLDLPATASRMMAKSSKPIKTLLQGYGEAIARSHATGRRVSFRVDVDPEGQTVITPVEDLIAPSNSAEQNVMVPDAALDVALAAARERGRLRAAEILSGIDMVSADEFARILGTTRVTVNTKRQNGQVLGLDGARRGFRFPIWQLGPEGKPYAELSALQERLGAPWAVYRFLVQPHAELDGLTGREALERGRFEATLAAAESVGRDFR